MARTMIDLDEEALVAAQRRLGTATKVQTVNEALRRVAAAPDQGATARAVVALLASSDIGNAEVMEKAWRSTPELG